MSDGSSKILTLPAATGREDCKRKQRNPFAFIHLLYGQDTSLLRLGLMLKPHWKRLMFSLGLLVLLTVTNIFVPQLFALVFNRVFPEQNWQLLFGILGGICLLYVLRNVLYFYSKYSAVQVGEKVSFDLRIKLFERLQQMSLGFYRKNNPGKLSSRVMNDSFVIQQFIQDDLPALMQSMLLFLGILITIYFMNFQLALASTLVLPFHFAAYLYFKKSIKRASRLAQDNLATANGNLIEKFLGIEVVKGFAGEKHEKETFQTAIHRSHQSELEGKRYHVMQKVVADLLIGLGLISLLGFGAYQVIGVEPSERLLPGSFIAFFWYIRMLYPTVSELTSGFAKMTKASAGVERVVDVLSSKPSWEEERAGKAKPDFKGAVSFKAVEFSYPQSSFHLNKISVDVAPGEVCAITGHTGAGKSSLMSLLSRFNQLNAGGISFDGLAHDSIDLDHLRSSIGVAFQECFLFNASILDNLKYANSQVTQEAIIEIAKQTGAHRFIEKLPEGYNTIIGEEGISLSRGQKQLITLIRALLNDPKILVLDEATASLDKEQEAVVIPAILKLMKGKTTFIVTHEPELLKHADIVLELKEGNLIKLERKNKKA